MSTYDFCIPDNAARPNLVAMWAKVMREAKMKVLVQDNEEEVSRRET